MRLVEKYERSGCVLVITEDILGYKANFYYPRGSGLAAETFMGSLNWIYRCAGMCEDKILKPKKEAA